MNEKQFQNKIIKSLRESNLVVQPMSLFNSPGFPDLFVDDINSTKLVELKVVHNLKIAMNKLFKSSQIPFYINYWNNLHKPSIHILFLIELPKDQYYLIVKITKKTIDVLKEARSYLDIEKSLFYKCSSGVDFKKSHVFSSIKYFLKG
jgi:hypothetical protein